MSQTTYPNYTLSKPVSSELLPEDIVLIVRGTNVVLRTTIASIIASTITALPPINDEQFCSGSCGLSVDKVPIDVASNGLVITATVNPSGGGGEESVEPSKHMLAEEWRELAVDSIVTLTQGTDVNPATNYVYAVYDSEEGSVVLGTSIAGWPETEHSKIAVVVVKSAATVFADPYGIVAIQPSQAHLCNTEGLFTALATSLSARTPLILEGGEVSVDDHGGTANISVSTTAITVVGVREREIAAIPDPARVVIPNHPTAPWSDFTNLVDTMVSTGGVPLPNNEYMVLTIGAVVGEDGAPSRVFGLLPNDFYSVGATAIADSSGFGNYAIPEEYRGSAVLLARLVIRRLGILYSFIESVDLRSVVGGGGGASRSVTVFGDNDFALFSAANPSSTLSIDLGGMDAAATLTLPGMVNVNTAYPALDVGEPISPGDRGYFYVTSTHLFVWCADLVGYRKIPHQAV